MKAPPNSPSRGAETPHPGGPGDARESAGEVVQGLVEVVTYADPESRYTVLKVFPERGYGDPQELLRSRVTAVGRTDAPGEGQRVRLTGSWTQHRVHGRQFAFDLCAILPPADAEGLVRYLASSTFQGIGETLARRIVDELGADAFNRIQEDPEQLARVKGLSEKVRQRLVATVREQLGAHELRAFLLGVGLGPWQAEAVIRKLGADCEERVRADPYALAEGIPGIGFQIADRVARGLGFSEDSPERLRAGLLHALRLAASDGHSLLPDVALLTRARELLRTELAEEDLRAGLEQLGALGDVKIEAELGREGDPEDCQLVYLPPYHTSEAGLARNLAELVASGSRAPLVDRSQFEGLARASKIELHPLQREAVLGLLTTAVGLLTGGPGVGKTTIVRLLVELAERGGAEVALASPTGRAAKRLSEATGRPASTVHRLLGFEPHSGGFAHDAHNPLEADLVIIDELSMLDVVLAYHLTKAVQPPTRLVFIGDPDQLPSVSAGNVLGDLIASGRVPVWRLTQIYRQDESSLIVENAHRILRGEMPRLPEPEDPPADFYFFGADEDEACAERVIDVVTRRIPQRFGLDWARDVQVLAPMYKGASGVDALNERLRAALDHPGHELHHRGRVWRTGDRVIHTRNDYDKEVFNGDMGRVHEVHGDATGLMVRYPERDVFYTPDELSDLSPAFAITVHRSQGGEFPAVVIPLSTRHYVMLQRNLFYTAVTRAQRLVVLVGSRRALALAVQNDEQSGRESALDARLRALLEGVE